MAGTHPSCRGSILHSQDREGTSCHGAALTAVAQSAQGTPLVYLADTRERRFVVLTFGPAESNLASAPGFPVLMGNAIDWLVRPEAHGARQTGLRDIRSWTTEQLIGPGNREMSLSRVGGATLATLRTPGLYTAKTAGATRHVRRQHGRSTGVESGADDVEPERSGASGQRRSLRPALVALLCDRRVRSRACRVVDVAAQDHRMTAPAMVAPRC